MVLGVPVALVMCLTWRPCDGKWVERLTRPQSMYDTNHLQRKRNWKNMQCTQSIMWIEECDQRRSMTNDDNEYGSLIDRYSNRKCVSVQYQYQYSTVLVSVSIGLVRFDSGIDSALSNEKIWSIHQSILNPTTTMWYVINHIFICISHMSYRILSYRFYITNNYSMPTQLYSCCAVLQHSVQYCCFRWFDWCVHWPIDWKLIQLFTI